MMVVLHLVLVFVQVVKHLAILRIVTTLVQTLARQLVKVIVIAHALVAVIQVAHAINFDLLAVSLLEYNFTPYNS